MENSARPRHLIIHGHFYQPPRENPWTETIERQESAAPYHDWNDRIANECYLPNSLSRRLDEYGRITKLVNNYEWISFNFGPTLISWLEDHVPETYARILEADRSSAKRLERARKRDRAVLQPRDHAARFAARPGDADPLGRPRLRAAIRTAERGDLASRDGDRRRRARDARRVRVPFRRTLAAPGAPRALSRRRIALEGRFERNDSSGIPLPLLRAGRQGEARFEDDSSTSSSTTRPSRRTSASTTCSGTETTSPTRSRSRTSAAATTSSSSRRTGRCTAITSRSPTWRSPISSNPPRRGATSR